MVNKEKLIEAIHSLEAINDHKEVLADEAKTVLMDAKKEGLDVGIIKEIMRLRKLKDGEFSDHQGLINEYMKALGMI